MTPAEAQRLQEDAELSGRWLMWFVAAAEGRVTARAMVADQHGGERLPGELVADTLAELRAMLPPGLTRWERTSVMSPEVLEVWD
jgi:hypothetical protein